MKCPDCNKFAGRTEAEVEHDIEIDPFTGDVSGPAQITNESECCGAPVEDYIFYVEMVHSDFDPDPDNHIGENDKPCRDSEYELVYLEVNRNTFKMQGRTPRKGGRIHYGVIVEARIRCTQCGTEFRSTWTDSVTLDDMEKLTD